MSEKNDIHNKIINIINEFHPSTIEDIINIVADELMVPKKKLMNYLIEMENSRLIRISDYQKIPHKKFRSFLFSYQSLWFWIIVITTFFTFLFIYKFESHFYQYYQISLIVGSIYVLFYPGFSLLKVLFPLKEFDFIEQLVISIGLSLFLVSFFGFILNYTFWGINRISVVFILLLFIIICSIMGIYNEFHKRSAYAHKNNILK